MIEILRQDVIQYIYARLIEQGLMMGEEDIGLILDLEMDFLEEIGLVEAIYDIDDDEEEQR